MREQVGFRRIRGRERCFRNTESRASGLRAGDLEAKMQTTRGGRAGRMKRGCPGGQSSRTGLVGQSWKERWALGRGKSEKAGAGCG